MRQNRNNKGRRPEAAENRPTTLWQIRVGPNATKGSELSPSRQETNPPTAGDSEPGVSLHSRPDSASEAHPSGAASAAQERAG
jgi:hypothetical protein